MMDKKIAVPGAQDRATANLAGGVVTSQDDFTPNSVRGQVRISDFLSNGRETALTQKDLSALTGYTPREIRRMIQNERRGGAVILSDSRNGFFLPDSSADIAKFLTSMRSRAREINLTLTAVERAAREGEVR